MLPIGELTKRTGVKVPTIRCYEQSGLLPKSHRTEGNQKCCGPAGLERLSFIKHARELGFSIHVIAALIELEENPDRSCKQATDISHEQLLLREKVRKLRALKTELECVTGGCVGEGKSKDCYVLDSLADHRHCHSAH